jgi:hypothetical protein
MPETERYTEVMAMLYLASGETTSTSECTFVVICKRCGALVSTAMIQHVKAHDAFHDSMLQRHATFSVTNDDGTTLVQFIDGTQVTLPSGHDGPLLELDMLSDFVRGVNEAIEPGYTQQVREASDG